MKRDFKIRAVEPRDIPYLKAVIDSSQLFPSEMLDDMIADYLGGAEDAGLWLALDDGEPIGIAYCLPERMTDGTWNLLLIAVHSERQRRGYGTAILEYVEDALSHQNVRLLLIETSGLEDFLGARSFYEKAGFKAEARIKEFYKAGEDKIVFSKILSGIVTVG